MGKRREAAERSAGGQATEQQRVIDALYHVTRFTSEITDLKRLLTLIMEESKQVMDSEASSCMLYDESTDELYFEVQYRDWNPAK